MYLITVRNPTTGYNETWLSYVHPAEAWVFLHKMEYPRNHARGRTYAGWAIDYATTVTEVEQTLEIFEEKYPDNIITIEDYENATE